MKTQYKTQLKDLFAKSVVAGVGFSLGRDVYRKTKGALFGWVLLAFFLGAAFTTWDIARGNRRSPNIDILFKILYGISTFFSIVYTCLLFGFFVGAVLQIVLGVAGYAVGKFQSVKRARQFAVEEFNEKFMRRHGLVRLGGQHDTIVDPHGRELVIVDVRLDGIILRATNCRGRARIALDPCGRMTAYVWTGV